MDFPALPDDLPEGTVRKKWQAFNTIICQADVYKRQFLG